MSELELKKELEECRKKLKEHYYKGLLFDFLIRRYRDYIETNEAKTIQDLKRMIDASNETVKKVADEVIRSIPDYSSEKVKEGVEAALKLISERIYSVPSLGINFWMTPEEVYEARVADYEDKAIFFCSVLKAMGLNASVLIAELSDGTNAPFVVVRNAKVFLVDPNNNLLFEAESFPEVVKKYEFNGVRITSLLYEFDDLKYEEYS